MERLPAGDEDGPCGISGGVAYSLKSYLSTIQLAILILNVKRIHGFRLYETRRLRLRGTRRKVILRRLLGRYLPAALFERPKQGFTAPLKTWFARELRGKCRNLARATIQMGRSRAELRPDLRSHPHGNYVIFFRYVSDALEVVNVLEGHRDVEAFFHKDER